jgi:hypothetical protein
MSHHYSPEADIDCMMGLPGMLLNPLVNLALLILPAFILEMRIRRKSAQAEPPKDAT